MVWLRGTRGEGVTDFLQFRGDQSRRIFVRVWFLLRCGSTPRRWKLRNGYVLRLSRPTILYVLHLITHPFPIIQATDADTEHKHTHEIEGQMQKISMALYDQRAGETEEQTLERAMRDPEVANIMQDPIIQQILQQAQSDPRALNDHMKNPTVREKINKLIAAGVIRTR